MACIFPILSIGNITVKITTTATQTHFHTQESEIQKTGQTRGISINHSTRMESSGPSTTQTRFHRAASFRLSHPAITDARGQHTPTRTKIARLIIVHYMQNMLNMEKKHAILKKIKILIHFLSLVQNQYFYLNSIPNYQIGQIFLVTKTQFPEKLNCLG